MEEERNENQIEQQEQEDMIEQEELQEEAIAEEQEGELEEELEQQENQEASAAADQNPNNNIFEQQQENNDSAEAQIEVQEPEESVHQSPQKEEVSIQRVQQPQQEQQTVIQTNREEHLERAVHALERKNYSLVLQADYNHRNMNEAAETIKKLQNEVSQLRQTHTASQYQLRKLGVQMQAVEKNRDEYKHLLQQAKHKLKEFEDVASTAELQHKLQLEQFRSKALAEEIEGLKLQIEQLQSTPSTGEPQMECFEAVDRMSFEIVEMRKQLLEKENENKTLFKHNEQYKGRCDEYESQIRLLNEQKSKQQQDRFVIQNRIRGLQLECERLTQNLVDRDIEVANLNNKLEQEGKRRREQGDSSNHLLQKQMILKDYLELEKNFNILHEEWEKAKATAKRLQAQLQRTKSSSISRNDYENLSKRYIKVKKCLQDAIKHNKKGPGSSTLANSDQAQGFVTKKTLTQYELEQLETLRRIVEQSNNRALFEDPETIAQIAKLRGQVKELQITLDRQAETMAILERELEGKENILASYRSRCNQYWLQLVQSSEENQKLKQKTDEYERNNSSEKTQIALYEARVLEMVAHIERLRKESAVWKHAYQSMKKYEQLNGANKDVQGDRASKDWLEQPKEKRIEFEIVRIPHINIDTEASTQTPSVEFHLEQLQQKLQKVTKTNETLNRLIDAMGSTKQEIEQEKIRLKQMQDKYNHRFKLLSDEKKEHEAWKSRTKDEIEKQVREDFNELRDLVDNDRLIKILRKAKYILQEYEKDDMEQPQDNQSNRSEHAGGSVEQEKPEQGEMEA